MKKLQFYRYATWTLLVLNLVMLAFFVFNKPHPPHKKNRGGVVERLNFDQQQHERFLEYLKVHHQKMTAFSKQQEDLLKPYFEQLIDTTSTIDSLAVFSAVQQLEEKKISAVYQHFQDVRSILRPEQEENFNERHYQEA